MLARLGPGALPVLAILGFVLLSLCATLVTGRIQIARSFSGSTYASRRDTPAIYWFFVLIHLGLATVLSWGVARRVWLDDVLAPEALTAVEAAAPYVAGAVFLVYAAATWALSRRRRARLRAAHPSAVERASGGV